METVNKNDLVHPERIQNNSIDSINERLKILQDGNKKSIETILDKLSHIDLKKYETLIKGIEKKCEEIRKEYR